MWWLAGLYVIHSIAELCISPVGLSMITKLSIARIVGMMMGVWFLSISVAQYFAGVVAQFASVETVGGQVTNLKVSLDTYLATFTTIALGRDHRRRAPVPAVLAASEMDARGQMIRPLDLLAGALAALAACAPEPAAQGARRSGSTRTPIPRPTSAIPGR